MCAHFAFGPKTRSKPRQEVSALLWLRIKFTSRSKGKQNKTAAFIMWNVDFGSIRNVSLSMSSWKPRNDPGAKPSQVMKHYKYWNKWIPSFVPRIHFTSYSSSLEFVMKHVLRQPAKPILRPTKEECDCDYAHSSQCTLVLTRLEKVNEEDAFAILLC